MAILNFFFNVYFSSLFILPSSPKQTFGYTEFSINTELLPPLTKVQYNRRHLMTLAFLTLAKGQGHTTRSKVTDVEASAFSECISKHFLVSQIYKGCLCMV